MSLPKPETKTIHRVCVLHVFQCCFNEACIISPSQLIVQILLKAEFTIQIVGTSGKKMGTNQTGLTEPFPQDMFLLCKMRSFGRLKRSSSYLIV